MYKKQWFRNLAFNIKPADFFKFVLQFLVPVCIISFFVADYILIPPWVVGVYVCLCSIKFQDIWNCISNLLKNLLLKQDFKIIEFNPWACKDEGQVIEEFLKTLANNLGQFDISGLILNYMKLIIDEKVEFNFNFDFQNADMANLHEKIAGELEKSNKKILVIFDDMDRMNGAEIYNVLRLIKVVANFPNIVYVLAYDKQYLIKELNSAKVQTPEAFLEKIITQECPLPKIPKKYLIEELVLKEVEELSKGNDNYEETSIKILATYDGGFNDYITNIRQYKKLMNAFKMHYKVFKDAGVQINVMDLLFITAIKTFDLELYNAIYKGKTSEDTGKLLPLEGDFIIENKQDEPVLFGIRKDQCKPSEWKIMEELFPENNHYNGFDLKRIRDNIDLYYSFSPAKSEMAKIKDCVIDYQLKFEEFKKIERNETFYSDLKDLMYSGHYHSIRDLNFAKNLMAIFIENKDIAQNVYSNTRRWFFSNKERFIENNNTFEMARFFLENAESEDIDINLFERILYDMLFWNHGARTDVRADLDDDLTKQKAELVAILKKKFEQSELTNVNGDTLDSLSEIYNFKNIFNEKAEAYLQKSDEEILSLIKHLCIYGKYDIQYDTGILKTLLSTEELRNKYIQRLEEIKNNNEAAMQNSDFMALALEALSKS